MNPQPSALKGNDLESGRLCALIAQLRTLRSGGMRDYWPVYGVALCYAVVTAIEGRGFFSVFAGMLVVVFMLHDRSIRRVDRQIDAVLETLQKLEDARRDA